MRTRSFLAVLACALAACVPAPPVTVVHVSKQQPLPPEDKSGEGLKTRRAGSDAYSNIHGGAYVVRSRADWEKMWSGKDDIPSIPPGIDLQREMMFVVATDDAIVSKLEIGRVIENGGNVTVLVRQVMLGEGCVRNKGDDRSGLDAIVTSRIDKPIKFIVEDEDSASCGAPPKAEVSCRVGAAKTWTPKVTAKSGEVVECELASVATGKYTLVDQVLSLGDVPPSSKSKLTFSKGSVRAKLSPDVFGTYAIRAEATDEAGRKGFGTATIEVLPKKTRDVQLQLSWSDTELLDPASPLPRVLLRVAAGGAKGQRCSAEVPVPGLCEAKTRGSYTYMKIPAGQRKLPLSLLYLDERAQSGASPCVHVWFNGERTTSICDHDHRHAEDKWELGSIDTATGKLVPVKPPAPPPPAPPPPAAAPPSAAPPPAPAPKN